MVSSILVAGITMSFHPPQKIPTSSPELSTHPQPATTMTVRETTPVPSRITAAVSRLSTAVVLLNTAKMRALTLPETVSETTVPLAISTASSAFPLVLPSVTAPWRDIYTTISASSTGLFNTISAQSGLSTEAASVIWLSKIHNYELSKSSSVGGGAKPTAQTAIRSPQVTVNQPPTEVEIVTRSWQARPVSRLGAGQLSMPFITTLVSGMNSINSSQYM